MTNIVFKALVVQNALPDTLDVSVQFGFKEEDKNCIQGTVPPNRQSTDIGLYSSSTLGPLYLVQDTVQFFEPILYLKIKCGHKTLFKGPPPTFPGFFANQLLATVDSHGQVSFSYD